MSCSKFQYVKKYELKQNLIPGTYIIMRIDGKGFTKFCQAHQLQKPNDIRLLRLMNKSALTVMKQFSEVGMAYGQSDQYSFCLRKSSQLYNRRPDKIISVMVSCFTGAFFFYWEQFFKQKMVYPATFDGRLVQYPSEKEMKDYFRWRQADCHINNLYNTCFWVLLKQGKSNQQAESILSKTKSDGKNQLLFQHQINYTKIQSIYRKGTIFFYNKKKDDKKAVLREESIDLIQQQFWDNIQRMD